MKPDQKDNAVLPPLTDELIESGADLSAYMTNVRSVPATTAETVREPQAICPPPARQREQAAG